MAPLREATLPATRRVRKSIGAHTDLSKAMDKENATVDVASSLAASRKKSRSKSIGPGGLDAMKQGNGNRRASLAVPPKLPRSILKPTMSLLPEIPPLKKPSTSKSAQGASSASNESSGSKIAVRTEEEQQAAAREREERERRDARRKSLANRRVSFAAEATLHTFHEVEHMQDSTTSRRKSNSASGGRDPTSQNNQAFSDNQEGSHQGRRRRSSLAAQSNLDDTIASTIYSSDSEPADAVEEIAADEEEEEDSNSDSDDGTMMSIEEVTGTSVVSDRSMDIADETSTLDEALRMAAKRAGTQRLIEDDSDDGEEIIPSFGWAKKGNQPAPSTENQEASNPPVQKNNAYPDDDGTEMEMDMDTDMDMDMDMDMTRAMGKIIKPLVTRELEQEPEQEMTMDVTTAFGAILSQSKNQPIASDSGEMDDEAMEEATMEFTTAIGGIHRPRAQEADEFDEDNEDMSMEMTTVIGGLLSQQKANNGAPRRRPLNRKFQSGLDDATMDMTVGLGRIITGARQSRDEDGDGDATVNMDATMGMDMTMAIGGILQNGATSPRTLGKRILESEVNKPNSPREAILAAVSQPSPKKGASLQSAAASTSESDSPGFFASWGKALRRSIGAQVSTESNDVARTPSPAKPSTPQQASASPKRRVLAPQIRTPQSASPRRLRSANTSRTPSPVKPAQSKNQSSFWGGSSTGNRTPTAVTPQTRRLSGVGADRHGLGSPQVAAIFERRESISDSATEFVPGKRGVAFEDPQELVEEIEKEREEGVDKEKRPQMFGHGTSAPQEDKDATLNLREMIDSLSPKRKPLKGRKSLHVGSARGLLGKRPTELDEQEEVEDNDGIKRLKGHQGSPVKNVKLQQPPSKAETTGRLTKASRLSFDDAGKFLPPPLSSPLKATTPLNQRRFKDVNDYQTVHEVQLHQSPVDDENQRRVDGDEDQIHLQDFLNMTSIRFMELTTTKRRHTIAPSTSQDGSSEDNQNDRSLERCIVAGACTVPTLELYQHSCRELKKYISEGRRIVKEIETETFEENPPLFREYMSATPEVKALMDNQFKNVKTHARHLSKAMWYEWRMKLQDGLKEGLINIAEGMDNDQNVLEEQENLLASVVPAIVSQYESRLEESNNLEEVARELADCDPAELEAARTELTTLDEDIAQKKKLIAKLRREFEASEVDVEELVVRKQKCLEDIKESERIREECRGWTGNEVHNLKARVDAIEKDHGWAVTGISGSTLSMTYKREIELVFDIASFQTHQPNSRIDLWYIADGRENNAVPKTVEKEFFLQCIRDHIRAMPQSRTKISHLLNVVRAAWDKANIVSLQVDRINVSFPTKVTRTSDSSIAMTSSLLLVPLETRVEVTLNLQGFSGPEGVNVDISTEAKVLYGEQFNVGKVGEFLGTRIGKRVGAGDEEWSNVVVELHERLIARGKK